VSARPYITCRQLIETLAAYLDRELPAVAVSDFERHLSVCVSCVAYIATYEKTIRMARGVAAYDESLVDSAPPELIDAVLVALRRA
jgi:anti-sigma factor RsiW